ncbi:MAG: hypothetical protein Q4D12_09070 [Bacteroidales bacterium]|nr:hypothetical protein [Bacteroidales bacterium]
MNTQEIETTLNYEIYERQLDVFLQMTEQLAKGWRDYSALELSIDLHSLCRKGARLFYMADLDWVAQQQDIVLERFKKNAAYLKAFERLMHEVFCPFIMDVTREMRGENRLNGVKLPYYDGGINDVFPRLQNFLIQDGMEVNQFESIRELVNKVFEVKPLQGQKNYPGETSMERFGNIYRLMVYVCYLNYHFQRCMDRCSHDLSGEQVERIFLEIIQQYAASEEGGQKLLTYRTRLEYDNDGQPLSLEQLRQAEKKLVQEVPESLQLSFMKNSQDPEKIVYDIIGHTLPKEDLQALTQVLAKCELLHGMMYELQHPKKVKAGLYNEVFHTQVNGRTVNLEELRDRIREMLYQVDKKNKWFCVWSVLRHHLLLKDTRFEPFARQMMHEDWFGNTNVPHFSGDNLSDYSGYFDKLDFKLWNESAFLEYRDFHGKKDKWGDSLFSTFESLTYELDDIYCGYGDY